MSLRLIEPSLHRVGVELINDEQPSLRCKTCGKIWNPELTSNGRLPKHWWKCPNTGQHHLYQKSSPEVGPTLQKYFSMNNRWAPVHSYLE